MAGRSDIQSRSDLSEHLPADQAKARAISIATVIQAKISDLDNRRSAFNN